MTPSEEHFNRDGGLEVPGCWTAVMKRQGGRRVPHRSLTSSDTLPSVVHGYNSSVCFILLHFCLDDNWSIQLKRPQVIFRAQVGNR